jgi:hypothetical protein
LPLLPKALKNYSRREIADFFRNNREQYPADIRQAIEALPSRNPTYSDLNAIDKSIRDFHTDVANRMAGYAGKADKPFLRSGRGISNEGGQFSSLVTDNKTLTLTGQLKSGGTVEFDSLQFNKSRLIETKMNLEMKTQDEVFDQMMRQASFARDWGWSEVRWEVWDYDSFQRAVAAFITLSDVHPDLAARITIANPEAAR